MTSQVSLPLSWVVAGLVILVLAILVAIPRRRRSGKYNGWEPNPATNRNPWAAHAPETDSPIEEKLLGAIRRTRGLPEPVLQFELRHQGRVLTIPDMAYPDQRIAIFVDSKAFHAQIGQLIDDARKRNILSMNGWVVLVYWGPEIYWDAAACARNIQEAFNLRERG